KGQMIGGDGGLKSCKHVNLARAADLENGAATVAHVEVLIGIKRQAGGHSHTFHVDGHVTGGRDLINDSLKPAGDIQHAFAVEGQTGGVHDVADEWPRGVVEVDLVNGDGSFLATRTA